MWCACAPARRASCCTSADGSSLHTLLGEPAGQLGFSVAAPGDVDGDGIPDLACGAHGYTPPGGETVGRVRVVSGADPTSVLHESLGPSGYPGYGRDLAGGDVNGDGRGDLLVAAPWVDIDGELNLGEVTRLDATCVASWTNVGLGLAGTAGVPRLKPLPADKPVLGQTLEIKTTNTAGAPTTAWFLLGISEVELPFKGGVLHTDPLIVVGIPLPLGITTLPLPLPDDDALCGAVLMAQLVAQDAGGPVGFAMSPGLRMVLGH